MKRNNEVKWGLHGRDELNDMSQRSVGLMVAGGYISWYMMSGL